jgi:quinol monooxygenase YgiN
MATASIPGPANGAFMTVVTTIDVYDMPNSEYRAVLDRMGVETRPEPGIYLHVTAQTDFGYRIIEIWNSQEAFEEFAQRRMLPALQDLGIDRTTEITVKPLHNLFAPRLNELPGLVDGLPGAPRA